MHSGMRYMRSILKIIATTFLRNSFPQLLIVLYFVWLRVLLFRNKRIFKMLRADSECTNGLHFLKLHSYNHTPWKKLKGSFPCFSKGFFGKIFDVEPMDVILLLKHTLCLIVSNIYMIDFKLFLPTSWSYTLTRRFLPKGNACWLIITYAKDCICYYKLKCYPKSHFANHLSRISYGRWHSIGINMPIYLFKK